MKNLKSKIQKAPFGSLGAFLLLLTISSCNKNKDVSDATGVFEATEVIVSSEAMGEILTFAVEEGTELKAGTTVGTIDCENLTLQKAQVQASIEAIGQKQNSAEPQIQIIREQIGTQQNQIATQKEQLRVMEKERNRLQNLVNADAIPSKQLDDLVGQVDVLKKQIQTAESQVNVLRQQMKSQQEQVSIQNRGILSEKKPLEQRVAQVNDQLRHCTIVNPMDGTVLVKYAEANEVTAMGKPLYKLADTRNMTLRAYLSGDLLPKVKLNQPVTVLIDNGKEGYKEVKGTVEWVSAKAEFTPKTIQTKDERANLVYAIKINVPNDGTIKIGMYGEVKL